MIPRHVIGIDYETFSSVDLKTCGVHKYAASPDFEILIVRYKIDDGTVYELDLTKPQLVELFISRLLSPDYLKTAFNAPFEMACSEAAFKITVDPAQWECTQAKAFTCGMQGGLDQIAQILKVGHKLPEGKSLITFFSKPCKPTKANGGKTRNYPHEHPDKFKRYGDYCTEDVNLEYRVRKILSAFETPPQERALWILDQKINRRGVMIDREFIRQAIAIDQVNSADLLLQLTELTGIPNGRSVPQLKKWLEAETGDDIDSLGKEEMPDILKKYEGSEIIEKALDLRKKTARTSTKKYEAMLRYAGADDRIRGWSQYCGASRTGRFAGRGVQPHNLRKSEVNDANLDLARRLVKAGDLQLLAFLYNDAKCNTTYPWQTLDVPDILSQLIRTAFIPSPGKIFRVSDFSAIEGRVIAWLAGEKWRLDVFKTHGKIYEASASAMFKVPLESVTKGSQMRQTGKVAELALGFGGGVAALARMEITYKVPQYLRIPDDQKQGVVDAWRAASPAIVQLWYRMGDAAIAAVNSPGEVFSVCKGISFQVRSNVLFMTLPSGRKLCYLRPRIVRNRFDGESVSYEGMEADSKKWGRVETYGGKLTENAVQAIARDILAAAMLRVDAAGLDIALHVHDEIVTEDYEDIGTLEDLNKLMAVLPDWAAGLPMRADGFETYYYKKES